MNQPNRILLVLDIDETLVHARKQPLDEPPHFHVYDYAVYRRPFLREFVETCAEWFDLGVWSSASDTYVDCMVDEIFPSRADLRFAWGRSQCEYHEVTSDVDDEVSFRAGHLNFLKPLSKLEPDGWPLDRVLIVDDSPEKCVLNEDNAIYPTPFHGDPGDDELLHLLDYLETLKDRVNVRAVEKRNWHPARPT